MRGDRIRRQPPAELPDDALWQKSRMVDAVEDDAARFLDLAAFADGTLDADDQERIAEWVAGNSDIAGDIAAARSLAAGPQPSAPASIVARACALVDPPPRRGNVTTLRWRLGTRLGPLPALRL